MRASQFIGLVTDGRRDLVFVFWLGLVGGEMTAWMGPGENGREMDEVCLLWVGRELIVLGDGVRVGGRKCGWMRGGDEKRGRGLSGGAWRRAFEPEDTLAGRTIGTTQNNASNTRRDPPPALFGSRPYCPQPPGRLSPTSLDPRLAMDPQAAQAVLNAPAASFSLALPFLLAPISPALAAIHAARARRVIPEDATLAATHCRACARPFLATGGQVRSVRKRQRPKQFHSDRDARDLRRSCGACGHVEDVPLGSTTGGAPALPRPRDRLRRGPSSTSTIVRPHVSRTAGPSRPPTDRDPSLPLASAPAQLASAHQRTASPTPVASSTTATSALAHLPPPSTEARGPSQASQRASRDTPAARVADDTRGKARPKKKTGLQNMLARNRERQEQEKKRDGGTQGQDLSAFLQGL